jgi:hypothetical protein
LGGPGGRISRVPRPVGTRTAGRRRPVRRRGSAANYGVVLFDRSLNTTIGGTTAADRNVISGNAGFGTYAKDGFTPTIKGNYIGTNAAGSAAVPNTSDGVAILQTVGVTVGGIDPGAGNIIPGNGGAGIHSFSKVGLLVQGNFIGLGADALTKIGNQRGVFVDNPAESSSSSVVIGGTVPEAGNVISGNARDGVLITSPLNTIQGGFIGTNAAGTLAVPNQVGAHVAAGANNRIGAKIVLSGNAVAGVLVENATGTRVVGNRIGTNVDGSQPIPNGTAAGLGAQARRGSAPAWSCWRRWPQLLLTTPAVPVTTNPSQTPALQ